MRFEKQQHWDQKMQNGSSLDYAAYDIAPLTPDSVMAPWLRDFLGMHRTKLALDPTFSVHKYHVYGAAFCICDGID